MMAEGTDSSVSITDLPQADQEVEVIEASHAGFDDDTTETHALQRESYHSTSAVPDEGAATVESRDSRPEDGNSVRRHDQFELSQPEGMTIQEAMIEWLDTKRQPVTYNQWQSRWFLLRRNKYKDSEESPGEKFSQERTQKRMRRLYDEMSAHYFGSDYLLRAAKAFNEEAKDKNTVAENLQNWELRGVVGSRESAESGRIVPLYGTGGSAVGTEQSHDTILEPPPPALKDQVRRPRRPLRLTTSDPGYMGGRFSPPIPEHGALQLELAPGTRGPERYEIGSGITEEIPRPSSALSNRSGGSVDSYTVSYTHLTLPTKRIV